MTKCGMRCLWSDCGSWCGRKEGHLGLHKCDAHGHTWSSWLQHECQSYCPICYQATNEVVSCMYPSPHMARHKGRCGHTWGWGF